MPKKNDNVVGRSEGPPVHGGHQTPQQAAIVRQEGGGISDAQRSKMTGATAHRGKGPPPVGGSSQGQSDQVAGSGPMEDRKIAGGPSRPEREHVAGKTRKHTPR